MQNPAALFPAEIARQSAPAIAFAQIPFNSGHAALITEVESLQPHLWTNHVNRQDYDGCWDVLPLRCQRRHLFAHAILQSFAIADGDDWDYLPVAAQCPQIRQLLDQLHCPIKSVRLMRLKAGAEIKPHRDHGLSMELGEARLHLPVQTNDAVRFIVAKKTVPMKAGELWYFNADQTHEVYNRSSQDRIHLVMDCVVTEWLRAEILKGAVYV